MQIKKNFATYSWIFFIGLLLSSFSLLQPSFEGFDENAHFSRILDSSINYKTQFYDNGLMFGSLMRYPGSKYPGPESYASGKPPFGNFNTYDNFYQSQTNLGLIKYFKVDLTKMDHYGGNWQYQHPPLFYLFAGYINRQLNIDTLVLNVVLLRLFSILLVIIALIVCSKTMQIITLNLNFKENTALNIGWIFSLCFPMFYFEFARIGNDSLVFLALSFVFYFSTKAYFSKNPKISILFMNLFLSIGLLTKAIVLPLVPIFIIYTFLLLISTNEKTTYLNFLFNFIKFCLLPLLIGLSWYFYSFIFLGNLGLGSEFQGINNLPDLISGLKENLSLNNSVRGLFVPIISFIYAGSGSLVRPLVLTYILLSFIYFIFILYYFSYLRLRKFDFFSFIPFLLVLSLYLGLVHHTLIGIAQTGFGASGGWYFYTLTPWILFILSISYQYLNILFIRAILFFGFAILIKLYCLNILIFSGFATKSDNKYASMVTYDLDQIFFDTIARLNYVSYPTPALILFFSAFIFLFIRLKKMGN